MTAWRRTAVAPGRGSRSMATLGATGLWDYARCVGIKSRLAHSRRSDDHLGLHCALSRAALTLVLQAGLAELRRVAGAEIGDHEPIAPA